MSNQVCWQDNDYLCFYSLSLIRLLFLANRIYINVDSLNKYLQSVIALPKNSEMNNFYPLAIHTFLTRLVQSSTPLSINRLHCFSQKKNLLITLQNQYNYWV